MTTPMMAQWEACKAEAKEALLLFRLGDFYEAFHDDAKLIAKELSLTLTARQGISMCGVPFHAADSYLDKLIAKGYTVAIAEQTEDPKATKGLIKREIVRIISPGTVIQSQRIEEKQNNYVATAVQLGSLYGLGLVDVTTGEFRVVEVSELSQLLDELYRFQPIELFIASSFHDAHKKSLQELSYSFTFFLHTKESGYFSLEKGIEQLTLHQLKTEELQKKPAALMAAGILVRYLKEQRRLSLEQIKKISMEKTELYLSLDRSTLRNLDLVSSSQGQSSTLLHFLDKTVTAMGGRLLRDWVKHPLLSIESIEKRQEAISELIQTDPDLLSRLEGLRDIERLITKVVAKAATPRDLLALGLSFQQVIPIQNLLTSFQAAEIRNCRSALADPISQKICSALSENPPIRIGEGAIFREGYHPELDALRTLGQSSISWMSEYQIRLREETGIKTLKVGYTQAFGYYIEVSRVQGDKVPSSFQRRQTLVNAERFITQELKEFEHRALSAEERSKAMEAKLFEELRGEIAEQALMIEQAAKAIGTIDALLSLASVAREHRWTRPVVDESSTLEIKEGRHPIVEKAIGRASFIANDTHFSKEEQLLLITGPNMAGKSTYIRQVALLVILAQMGSFIPATQARIGLVDKIFSRIGASDDLARGQSTFMVEMSETAHILNQATSKSLVLLDEIGRGTSTYDGISIAWAVADYLLTSSGAKTLFATHYWELTRLEGLVRGAANYQVAIQETADGIVFLRKIIKGSTDKSCGIHVAKIAGLPPKVIKKAELMLKQLESKYPKPKTASKEEQLLLL